jgi:enamine deaminase RidA (YjgF/YER057c/UK114 family)
MAERQRRHIGGDSPFEAKAAYSRAVQTGHRVLVSGTADLGADGRAQHPNDAYGQTKAAFQRALEAIREVGGKPADVVRTRIFIAAGEDWEGPVRAHGELFAEVNPANTTLYVAGLIPDGALVEVEVEAELDGDDRR